MTPTNSSSFAHGNNSSNTIVWTGKDIPCLGIKYGDILSKVIHTIACKVCDLAGDIDVSSVDLSCLIDAPNPSPDDKNVKLILQLLLDNQCKLKDLIDAIQPGGSGTTTLTLNMKCLTKYDAFNNPIPQDLNQTLQSIVDQVCTSKTDIAIIKTDIQQLEADIAALQNVPPYTEPSIITCLNVSTKPVSQVVPIAANAICAINTNLGDTTDVQGAIGRQCPNPGAEITSTLGWINGPSNLSQSLNNIWIALCNVLQRVKAIEQTCCAPSCDKIKLGFEVEFNYDDHEMEIHFTSGAGTNIPSGFEDCGTVLTVTDETGYVKTYTNLQIENGAVVGPLSTSGLSAGTLTFNLKTKFCLVDDVGSVIMVCQDCITEEVDFTNGCCGVTNTSSENVVIIYEITI